MAGAAAVGRVARRAARAGVDAGGGGAYHDADHKIDVNRSEDLIIACSSD
ncbi:hypothetical protein ACFV98_35540 [Streptomyces violascens]